MMRSSFTILLVLLMMVAFSCAVNYEIVSEKEENTNFSKFRSYTIIHDDHGFEIGADPIYMERIDQAVTRELEDMGYVETEDPDLLVTWFIKIDTKLEQGIYNAYYSKWRYPRAVDVYEYKEGSLVIDLIDSKNGEVVWHAKVSNKVTEGMPNIESKIKEVVKALFKSYRKDTFTKKIITYAFK